MTVQRDIFTNGWYAERFRPESRSEPFRNLYIAKRKDVVTIVGRMPEGSRVLDLGGGMGRLAIPLARQHQVTLCDISEAMLEMAGTASRAAGVADGRLTLRRVDAGQPLPFRDASFDVAIAIDLLVHLVEPLLALRELRRVMTPSGQLLVDVTNRSPWWTLRYPGYVGRRPSRWLRTWQGGGVPPEWQSIVRHQTHSEFRGMLELAGFRVLEEIRYGPSLCPKWFLSRCAISR